MVIVDYDQQYTVNIVNIINIYNIYCKYYQRWSLYLELVKPLSQSQTYIVNIINVYNISGKSSY